MSPEAVNTIGLIANIAGVALAFKFGYPQPSHEEGIGLGLEDATPLDGGRTVAEHSEDVRKQKRRYLFWSRAGLALMFGGFVLQLVATWIARL
ncbi:MAG: hypothetical protein ABL904_15945 [Hyphomicrobiaceae bacterium]